MKSYRPSLSARMGAALLALASGIVFIFMGCSNPASSSDGGNAKGWTWIAGSSSVSQAGTYPDAVGGTGTPGARYRTATCTDSDGNLWLFGGYGYGASSSGYLNDLWKCDSSGTWTWIAGSSSVSQAGTYPDAVGGTGTPGGRYGAAAWYDSDNKILWLFGGYGYYTSSSGTGCLNDLWKYDIDAGTWTWVAGSNSRNQTGTYTGDTLAPGSRYGIAAWVDSDGNFWLFGGYGYGSSSSIGYLNDLWKCSSSGTWTCVEDNESINQTGTYPDAVGGTGAPGARMYTAACSDSSGNLWLFGGDGYSSSLGALNDLWKYDTSAGTWTWVAGTSSVDQAGTYPSATGSTGTPGGRNWAATWADSDDNIWLFGGDGYNSKNKEGDFNDLWKYDISAGTWTWILGSSSINQTGTYPSATGSTGTPGGRFASAAWADSDGNFWLFGGGGYGASSSFGRLNDLWKYGD